MAKSYKNNLVENALLRQLARTFNTNLLKTEVLPYLYRKIAEFPEEVWIMRYAVFVLLHSFQSYAINTVLLSVGITNRTRSNFWSCLNCSDRIKITNACDDNCSKGYTKLFQYKNLTVAVGTVFLVLLDLSNQLLDSLCA